MTSEEKTRFRQTVAWKRFRERKIAEVKKLDKKGKLRCEMKGTLLSDRAAQCHHLFPDQYDLLELDRFRILSPKSHDFVEDMARVLHGKSPVPNREKWMELLGPFLPSTESHEYRYHIADCLSKVPKSDTFDWKNDEP
jgi:hypothetical protein